MKKSFLELKRIQYVVFVKVKNGIEMRYYKRKERKTINLEHNGSQLEDFVEK